MPFYVSSSQSPSNLFIYNFETKEVKQLTNTMSKEVDPNDLVAGEVVQFKSYDGLEIPACSTNQRPCRRRKSPYSALDSRCTGGQTWLGYSSIIQHLVNHGYVILAVNNRGSSGYGKSFFCCRWPQTWRCRFERLRWVQKAVGYFAFASIWIRSASWVAVMVVTWPWPRLLSHQKNLKWAWTYLQPTGWERKEHSTLVGVIPYSTLYWVRWPNNCRLDSALQ